MLNTEFYCCAYDECHGCEEQYGNLKSKYQDVWWSSFTSVWNWIAHNNALVQINKFLIDDLAKSEDLLEHARVKTGNKKWALPKC